MAQLLWQMGKSFRDFQIPPKTEDCLAELTQIFEKIFQEISAAHGSRSRN